MPNDTDILLESLAWRSLDRYTLDNPKPRLSPRTKHRCKLWIRERIAGNIRLRDVDPHHYYYPINDREGDEMLQYARRTLDD